MVVLLGVEYLMHCKAKSIKRIELSVAPTDNNRIFLSTEAGTTVAFYISDDAGATFTELTYATSDSKEILSTQGWYDNMVAPTLLIKI
jgi:hypothetical protein